MNNKLPTPSKLSRQDKFWFIPRSYFDRAGWDEMYDVNFNYEIDYNDYEIVLPTDINNDGNIEIDNVDINDNDSDNSYNSYNSDDNSDDEIDN